MATKKRQTNTQLVTDMMEFSRYGALVQVFVLQALEQYSKEVMAIDPASVDTGFISGAAWVGVAKEINEKIKAHFGS